MEQNIEKKLKKYTELIKLGEQTLKKHGWNEDDNNMYKRGAPSNEDYSGYLNSCVSLIEDTLENDSSSYLMIKKLIDNEKTSRNSYYFADCFGIIKAAFGIYKEKNMSENKLDVEKTKLDNTRIRENDMNKKVFVIHGRNEKIRKAFFEFLRSIGLQPIEWEQAIKLTGKSSPYIGEILEAALNEAKAIIVLFTPDEIAILKEEYAQNSSEKNPVFQPRPNVIFEAGMAIDKNPDRTIIVEIGKIREISDITGRHVVKFDGTSKKRKELIIKLNNAGCNVDDSGSAWLEAGDFTHITKNKQNLLKKIENFLKQTQTKKEHPKFKLHSAIYGTDEFFFDVYDKLNSMVNKNGLTVTSSNKIAGDPHKKAKKKLIIRYESYGKEYKVEVPENETRTLP